MTGPPTGSASEGPVPGMARQALYASWRRHYINIPAEQRRATALKRADSILKGMLKLARFKGEEFHEFNRRGLQAAYGMAYGVHKQLLGGLTSPSQGGNLRGGRVGLVR